MNLDLPGDMTEAEGILGPGVYALVWCGEVVYVGKATQVLQRINSHRTALLNERKRKTTRKAIPFSTFWFKPCAHSDLDRLEQELITKWQPKFNKLGKGVRGRLSLEEVGFDLTRLSRTNVVATPVYRRVIVDAPPIQPHVPRVTLSGRRVV